MMYIPKTLNVTTANEHSKKPPTPAIGRNHKTPKKLSQWDRQ